jgi:hypothetical protein
MGTIKNRTRDRVVQSSTLLLYSIGVLLVLLLTIPKGDSLWAKQLRIDAQVNAGTWITPTETATATPTLTETPTPTLTPTETSLGQGGTSIEVKLIARGFRAGDVDLVYGVEGQVCVTNVGDVPTENLSIHNIVETKTTAGPFEEYLDFNVDVSGKSVLNPGQDYCFPYFKTFTPSEDPETKYRNSAEVSITNHSGWLPGGKQCPGPENCPFGPIEKEDFDFNGLLIFLQSDVTSTITPTPTPSLTTTDTITETPYGTPAETQVDSPTPFLTDIPDFTPTISQTPTILENPTVTLPFTPTLEVIPPTDTLIPTSEPPLTETTEP